MGFLLLLAWPFLILIYVLLLAVIIPTLVFSIVNLKTGLKNKWPTKSIIGFVICGIVFLVFFTLLIFITVYIIQGFSSSKTSGSSASIKSIEEGASIAYNAFKYWLVSML